jgi:hypothetical protein
VLLLAFRTGARVTRSQARIQLVKYLLDKLDTSDQVHAKVNEGPLNTLPRIFLLFKDKHMVIEELLKLLVREVDTELLEAVKLFESKW